MSVHKDVKANRFVFNDPLLRQQYDPRAFSGSSNTGDLGLFGYYKDTDNNVKATGLLKQQGSDTFELLDHIDQSNVSSTSGKYGTNLSISGSKSYAKFTVGDIKSKANVDIDGTLTVAQTSYLNGDVIVDSSKTVQANHFKSAATNARVTIDQQANAVQLLDNTNIVLGGLAKMYRDSADASMNLVSGNASTDGTLRLTGNKNGATATFLVEGDGASIDKKLVVGTSLAVGDVMTVAKKATLSDELDVAKATLLRDTLQVNGAASLNNTLAVSGAATLSNTLAVTGATTLSNTLDVSGQVTATNGIRTASSNPGFNLTNSSLTINGFAPALNSGVDVTGQTNVAKGASDAFVSGQSGANNTFALYGKNNTSIDDLDGNVNISAGSSSSNGSVVLSAVGVGNGKQSSLTVGPDGVEIKGNLTVDNINILANNVTTVKTSELVVSDPFIKLGDGNATDSLDLGIYSTYKKNGQQLYSGLARGHGTDSWYYLFDNLTSEPGTTIGADLDDAANVNKLANLRLKNLSIAGSIAMEGNAVMNGDLSVTGSIKTGYTLIDNTDGTKASVVATTSMSVVDIINGSTDVTVRLPALAQAKGQQIYFIKCDDTPSKYVDIKGALVNGVEEQIDFDTANVVALMNRGDHVLLLASATSWVVM